MKESELCQGHYRFCQKKRKLLLKELSERERERERERKNKSKLNWLEKRGRKKRHLTALGHKYKKILDEGLGIEKQEKVMTAADLIENGRKNKKSL